MRPLWRRAWSDGRREDWRMRDKSDMSKYGANKELKPRAKEIAIEGTINREMAQISASPYEATVLAHRCPRRHHDPSRKTQLHNLQSPPPPACIPVLSSPLFPQESPWRASISSLRRISDQQNERKRRGRGSENMDGWRGVG